MGNFRFSVGTSANPASVGDDDGSMTNYEILPRALSVLRAIGEGQIAYSDLAGRFQFSLARLSYLLRRLERDGLIERRRRYIDHRRTMIVLTDEGRKHLNRLNSGGLDGAVEDLAARPRHLPSLMPRGDSAKRPEGQDDLVNAFCGLICQQLHAMPPESRAGIAAAIIMVLGTLQGKLPQGDMRDGDLASIANTLKHRVDPEASSRCGDLNKL